MELRNTPWGNQKGLGQGPGQLLIINNIVLVFIAAGTQSYVLVFAASYARFMCFPYFHKLMGKSNLKEGKNKQKKDLLVF